jgi:hypothetical protein
MERITKVLEISKFRPTIPRFYRMKMELLDRLVLLLHILSFVEKLLKNLNAFSK